VPSDLYGKAVILISATVMLSGCAAPAPDLPRIMRHTTEPGYATEAAAVAGETVAAQYVQEVPIAQDKYNILYNANPTNVVRELSPSKKSIQLDSAIWDSFSQEDQARIQEKYETVIVSPEEYGVVTDVQGVNQSTPGTNAGAAIGGAVASAGYIDHSLRGGSYSALAHLAVGLLGAIVGSSMDKAPISQFQFRYTVKRGDGEIQYFDEMKSNSFSHSVGVCVLIPSLTLVSQQLCQQTPESVRSRFLGAAVAPQQ